MGDPLSLTLPPLPGERCNPVARSLEPQIDKLLVALFETRSLLSGFGRPSLEPSDKLKRA